MKKAYEETNIAAIGSAIKTLVGGNSGYKVSQMAGVITDELQKKVSGTKNITANGTYDISEFAEANVNVSGGGGDATIVSKSITSNGTYNASDDDADGYDPVIVNVPQANIQESKTVTQNGTVTPDSGYDAIAQLVVNVSGGITEVKKMTFVGDDTANMVIENEWGEIPKEIVIISEPYTGEMPWRTQCHMNYTRTQPKAGGEIITDGYMNCYNTGTFAYRGIGQWYGAYEFTEEHFVLPAFSDSFAWRHEITYTLYAIF